MTWKNTIENIIIIAVMFVGLGIYTQLILQPILVESIRQETTKVETNIESKINNKFKKIDNLNNKLDNVLPTRASISSANELPIRNQVLDTDCPEGSVCIPVANLTRRQRRRLGM